MHQRSDDEKAEVRGVYLACEVVPAESLDFSSFDTSFFHRPSFGRASSSRLNGRPGIIPSITLSSRFPPTIFHDADAAPGNAFAPTGPFRFFPLRGPFRFYYGERFSHRHRANNLSRACCSFVHLFHPCGPPIRYTATRHRFLAPKFAA